MWVNYETAIQMLRFEAGVERPKVLRMYRKEGSGPMFEADYRKPYIVGVDWIEEHVLAVEICNTPKGNALVEVWEKKHVK